MAEHYELDYAALTAARETLKGAAESLGRAARGPGALPELNAVELSRCAAMCEVAEDAIFNALNTLAHHADDPRALALVSGGDVADA